MKASKVSVLIIAGALITGLAAAGAARTGVAEELWRSLALLAAAGVFVFLATTTARFHRLLALASASPGALAARTAVAMPRRRVWMVHCLIAVIIAGHLYCIASREEHWPFSRYPMYSGILPDPLRWERLYGVTAEGEVRLPASQYLKPFDDARLAKAFERLRASPKRSELFERALVSCRDRYEALRLAGKHAGPRLRGFRIYELAWKLDPWARNADHPDRKTLLHEVLWEPE